ncbi:MAG: hypothetical protein GY868_01455, partial [Deltaproteobacteria bacterium]|nr:hypothetical protein [Deltaproteobacteria bacterium]
PGKKQLFRITSPDGTFENDIITLEHEQIDAAPLLEPVITQGNRLKTRQGITQTRNYCQEALFRIPAALKEPRTREAYPVNLSQPLRDLVDRLTEDHGP